MATRHYATTNRRIDEVLELIDELIGWAEADAQHAAENDAPGIARDDRRRAKALRRARYELEGCYRTP